MGDIVLVSTAGDNLAENQRKQNYSITLQFDDEVKETYSIKTKLRSNSKLVLESEKSILNNLSITKLVKELHSSADLMHLAYVALSARKIDNLQSTVAGLHKSLLDATGKAATTMVAFERLSGSIVMDVYTAYTWIIQEKEVMGVEKLQKCGDKARQMANEAHKLANEIGRAHV